LTRGASAWLAHAGLRGQMYRVREAVISK